MIYLLCSLILSYKSKSNTGQMCRELNYFSMLLEILTCYVNICVHWSLNSGNKGGTNPRTQLILIKLFSSTWQMAFCH